MGAYLDWNATAPLRPCARAAWCEAQDRTWANPASTHRPGQQARAALDAALATCARVLRCHADELVLVSGGTEALATVLRGADGPVAAAAIDHSAVLRNADASRLRLCPVDGDGRIDPAGLARTAAGASVVCIQLANNEVGTVQDAAALAAAARAAAPDAILLGDACQLAGRQPLIPSELGLDALAIAGHKLGAPKGVGLLWLRRGLRLPPLLRGGRQQQDRRSGSEDAALGAALAAAFAEADAEAGAEAARQGALIDGLWSELAAASPAARRLAAGAPRLRNTLGIVHPGVDGRHLAMRLDLAGWAVSTGAACMAARAEPSHVVLALGLPPALAGSFIRISIGRLTRGADLAGFAEAYAMAVRALAT